METVIVTTESRLVEIIETVVGKFLRVEMPKAKVEPDNLSGSKPAVRFLCENGFEVSMSLFNKQVSRGNIPCRRFHNKRLLFKKQDLLSWAESKCEPIGPSDVALTLARSANLKLRGGRSNGSK